MARSWEDLGAAAVTRSVTRRTSIVQKVKTQFGSMYIHLELNHLGQPTGGWISDPGKEPDSQISLLVETLSEGLNEAAQDRRT